MSTLVSKQIDFSLAVAQLIIFAATNNYGITFGEAWRTDEQQEIYLKSGKSKSKRSNHQDRLAIDLNLFKDGHYLTDPSSYRLLGEEWEKLGGRWGGRFGIPPIDWSSKVGWDSNHFEWPL